MSLTININDLSLCHKGSGGVSTATIPDVCKTPSPGGPVPIPYPNVAFSKDLAKGTKTITADGGNMCANFGSEFSKSTGDEAGSVGGVKSSTFIKEATWITYSFDVKLEGKPACRLSDKMFHNHLNTVNAFGELHAAFLKFKDLICPIICKYSDKEKRGKLPKGKSTWTQVINEELKAQSGAAVKALGVEAEKSAVAAFAKGAAQAAGRSAIKNFGAKALMRRAGLFLVPVVGQTIGVVMLVVDVATTVIETSEAVTALYEIYRFRPDYTITVGGNSMPVEIKLPGDKWSPGQFEAQKAMNGGNDPEELNEATCDCKNKKKP